MFQTCLTWLAFVALAAITLAAAGRVALREVPARPAVATQPNPDWLARDRAGENSPRQSKNNLARLVTAANSAGHLPPGVGPEPEQLQAVEQWVLRWYRKQARRYNAQLAADREKFLDARIDEISVLTRLLPIGKQRPIPTDERTSAPAILAAGLPHIMSWAGGLIESSPSQQRSQLMAFHEALSTRLTLRLANGTAFDGQPNP